MPLIKEGNTIGGSASDSGLLGSVTAGSRFFSFREQVVYFIEIAAHTWSLIGCETISGSLLCHQWRFENRWHGGLVSMLKCYDFFFFLTLWRSGCPGICCSLSLLAYARFSTSQKKCVCGVKGYGSHREFKKKKSFFGHLVSYPKSHHLSGKL